MCDHDNCSSFIELIQIIKYFKFISCIKRICGLVKKQIGGISINCSRN